MNIYITYEKSFFTNDQINEIKKYGNIIFLESYFNLQDAEYFKR